MKIKIKDIFLFQCIVVSALMGFLIFGYFILQGNGAFTVVDDFNAQQLTFASAVRNALRSGNPGEWIWNLDLGASLITGFSFYNLGSPFYWPSVLFPKGTFPYLAGYLYVIKYIVASITAYLFLKRFVNNKGYAVVGALLYAFSGFQTTNLEFFHFHDVVALFPLMLIGLDIVMENRKKKILFIVAIFLNCLVNYFFFIEEVIFLIIYFLFRYWGKPIRELGKDITACMLCGIIGVGMAGVLFVPNVMYALGNSRSSTTWFLEDFFYEPKEFLFILKGILFPGDAMNAQSAIDDSNWDSTSCYLPLVGISMVMAFGEKENNWLKRLIIFLLLISCSPILQSGFYLFSSVYQRWWHMLVMMLVLATVYVLDKPNEYRINKYAIINVVIVILFYYLVCNVDWNDYTKPLVFYSGRFQKYFLIAVLGPTIIALISKVKKRRYELTLVVVALFCIATTMLTLRYYRVGVDTEEYMHNYKLGTQLTSIDDQYRYNSTRNELMLTGDANGIGAFCSTVENSSREFDQMFEHSSPNSTEKKNDIPGLTQLLAGKYYITQDSSIKNIVSTHEVDGIEYYVAEGNACPIGFAVDSYILQADFLDLEKEKRAIVLMNAAVVDVAGEKQVLEYADRFDVDGFDFEKEIDESITSTQKQAVCNFIKDSSGFSCSTHYDEDKLVYFSVPFSKGWRATLDGENVEVINSGGMMLLKVPSGQHDIQFEYHTPGFKTGIILSVCSFIIFGILVFCYKKNSDNSCNVEN